ncbi:MAG: type II secretion system F family protein [Armatimonadota bacterium]
MTGFNYKAKDQSGCTVTGTMEGTDERSVRLQLRELGYYVLDLRKRRNGNAARVVNQILGGVPARDMAVFYRELTTMLRAGMSIHQAASLLSQQGVSRRLRRVCAECVPHLQSGGKLSEVLARYPWLFPEMHISLIQTGETGGSLDLMFERLSEYMEHEYALRQKLRMQTFYPKILVLAVIFIPSLPTLIFKGTGAYLAATLGTLAHLLFWGLLLWAIYRLLCLIPSVRYAFDMLKLAIPKIGPASKMLAIGRFCRVFSTMWSAGIPPAQGVLHGARATGNAYLARRLMAAAPLVEQGESLTTALARTYVLQPLMLNMLSTGEHTGNMDEMLDKAAVYSESEGALALNQSAVVIGVLLYLGVALYIASVVISGWEGYGSQLNDLTKQ